MKLDSIHNRTQNLGIETSPFNPRNVVLTEKDIEDIFSRAGYDCADFMKSNIDLVRTAFVHKSYVLRKNDSFEKGNELCPEGCMPLQEMPYERLEFLGDAILGASVADYLYTRYPGSNCAEGFLSSMRTKLVNGKMLASLARKLNLGPHLVISRQLEESGGRDHADILEDALEALIGAVFQTIKRVCSTEDPYREASRFIIGVLERHVNFVDLVRADVNPKEKLGRIMKQQLNDHPVYTVERGGVVQVKDRKGRVYGTGRGDTKRDAEYAAANEALRYFGR